MNPSSSTSLHISVTLEFRWIKPSGHDGPTGMFSSYISSQFGSIWSYTPGFGPIRPVFLPCSPPRSLPMVTSGSRLWDGLYFGFGSYESVLLALHSESEILTACSYKTNPESIFWLMREQRRMKTVVPIIFIKMHFGFIFFSGLELQKSSYKSTRNSKLLFPSTINIIYYESECEGFK